MASSAAIKEAAWLKSLLEELRCALWTVKIYFDNQGCIATLRNPVYSKHTKHIAVQFHLHVRPLRKATLISSMLSQRKIMLI